PDPIAIVNGFQLSNVIIQTVYAQSEVPGLVDAVLDRYYEEIAEAHTAHDRLRAIGRVVRNLYIIHPFVDANRRLNVHVLLPKLLLEQGFQPVVRPDMAMLFQGGFSTDQIADALLEGQQDDLSAETEVSPAEEWVTIRDWVLGVLGEAGPDPGTPMLQLAEALREFDDVLTREFEDDAAYDQAYSDATDHIAMAANALTDLAETGSTPAGPAERGVTTVVDAAMRLVGGLRWRGASSPEASSGWSIGETTRWGHPNHFGRWIRDTGPEPNEWSTMNCWEAVLFVAYRAGAVDEAWLRRIHAEAAEAAAAALAVATAENPGGTFGGRHLATDAYGQLASLGEVTYDAELMKRFYQGELSEYEVTAVEKPAIPAGHWIFFNGTNHVGMSLGTRDEQGRQRMLSLWTFPAHIPAGPTDQAYTYGNLQVTTVEELIESGDLAGQKVEHATPVWEPSPASGAAEGSRQASGDGGRDDSAHLPDRGPDAGREDAGQGARGLSRAGRTLLGGLNGAANDTAQSRPMLGRDFFGLHTAPTRPSFMVDVDDVSTDRLPSLFRALDLTHPDAPTQQELRNLQPSPDEVWIDDRSYQARLDDLLAQGRFNVEDYDSSVVMDHLAETPRAEMPKVLHEMWVGSVFDPTDESNRQHADNLARLAAEARSHNWMMVLWTDQPRHLFQSADVSPEIERMRDWARENGIVLLNDDELLSGQDVDPLDAQLEPFAQMENAKLTRLGSVARSDIKRLRAVYAFGGYYNDLDNEFITFDGLEDIFSGPGFGVHHDGAGYGNSGFFATRRHIAIREFKRQQAMNYSISERALYWNDAKLRDTRNIYSLTSRSGNELIVTSGVSRARRYSVIKRTGPDIIRHVSSALEYDDGYLPRVSQFTMGSANSWMPRQGSPLRAPRTYAAQDVGWVLQRVISTLVRGLYDRDGDLHLTAVAPVINGLPDPAAAWEAVLAFILERDSLADRIRTITDQVLYYTDRYETDRVDLPSSIAGRLYIEYGNGEWLLGERFRRAVVRRDRTRELPAPPTVPTATGTRPVQADGEDTSADSSVPPVRPPGDLGTAPEPPAVPAEEPAPAQRATDLVTLLRDGGLTRIADYLEAGKVPQIQLTEGVQRRLISPANADDPLSRAVDALIASPEVQVLDAEGHLVSPATDTDDTASSAASGRAEERFLIRASGNVSGPFELAAAEGDTWQKSSWSRPEEPGGPV
ncbi:MAG: hypothetical protein JWQ95_7238, partial [Sphaerisporangium sp.]|nr:hypothetical protein [Sphaerisporangium sp.]